MEPLFWLIPDRIAGCAGPNQQPWNIAGLRQTGIRAVLSINDGELCHPEGFAREGIVYACLPLSPNVPSRPGDLERCLNVLPHVYSFLCEQMKMITQCWFIAPR